MNTAPLQSKSGLILTGGGARAAYQVGVLRAISRLLPEQQTCPFPILCGTSAGAINAAALASHAQSFHKAVQQLYILWGSLHTDQVFRSDAIGVIQTGASWLMAMMLGGLGKNNPLFLLDRTPLYQLLDSYLHIRNIHEAIKADHIHALSVTASDYSSHNSVTFFQAHESVKDWQRIRRVGQPGKINIEHIMASSAIPFLFAPIKVGDDYYGDGSMSQIAPISPALHLGADRVLVIGNRHESAAIEMQPRLDEQPTIGQIAGHALDSIFLDSLEADIERVNRINRTIELIPEEQRVEHGFKLRKIDVLVVTPSEDLGEMAQDYAHTLSRPVRMLMRGIGAYRRKGSSLISYLLFEKDYCRKLIRLGYRDAMAKRHELKAFLMPDNNQR